MVPPERTPNSRYSPSTRACFEAIDSTPKASLRIKRIGHVGLDVRDRLVERLLEEGVVGVPLVGVVVVAVKRPHPCGHDRADDAIETATELLLEVHRCRR